MYLKSIEIQGFKSFANKLLFEFHDGITGIVGPNGSGKSNVADAVRWVLGEQSAKQLRGAKMEDVIFSGTEARRPLGFASVAITLNNSDHKLPISYDEVTVARRVYRSGESEYLINGTNCRLRDVQELFLDTGIGKEGYSIIGQGQIDKILSGKPEDRRELFDEAAGIVKYKKRKASAEKNLESERQNLCRVEDILREIEKQLTPLENQSIKAREFLKLRDELKTYDVNMFLLDYDRIHDTGKELDNKIGIAENDTKTAKEEYQNTKEQYSKLEIQMERYDESLEKTKNSLSESKLSKEQSEGSIKVLKEQIIAAEQNDRHYKDRLLGIAKEKEEKEVQLNRYEAENKEISEKLESLKQSQSGQEEKLEQIKANIQLFTKEIEHCNSEIFEYLNNNSMIKMNLQRYETILEQNNIKKVSLNQKLLKNKSDQAVFDESVEEQSTKYKEVSEQIDTINKVNESIEQKLAELQSIMEADRKKLSLAQQEYQIERSKLKSLKNITERYEGYGNSIRKIMEHKTEQPGIIGVVADIIKVNKKYETAIETALGGSIQNIVTDNEITAKNLIDYLKKNKYGRATFLPLTSITSRSGFINDRVLGEEGVIGTASSLIEADSKYHGLIEYLLGKIVVVDHIENAITLAKKNNYSLRIVTIEGELLNPGGSMSGGAYKNSSNLLSRRREMDDIKIKIETLESQIKEFEKKQEDEREERAGRREVIEKNKSQIQELSLQQNTLKINIHQSETKKAELAQLYQELLTESKEIDVQSMDLKENISILQEELSENEGKSKDNETEVEKLNQLLEKEKEKEQKSQEQVSELKMEYNSLWQSSRYVLENCKRIKNENSRLEEEVAEIKRNMEETAQRVKDREQDIERTSAQLMNLNDRISDYEKQIVKTQEEKDTVLKQHKEFFVKREELSHRLNELDKEAFRLASQKEKLSEQLEQLMNYMWEEYELTYSSAYPLKIQELNDQAEIKKTINTLKLQIRNLGDVNVNAIKDYKELLDRYELLKTQHDDLIKAEEVLKQIILELDSEMRKQFDEKFQAIKIQFDLVFKELFGGGKGTLELMENEDILEAGIKIIAQPPGKKLQNMMQLSGGEKALTAISLLFAIQNLKPSPFCLLDEIEAALDDSNVTRFAKYLHKLTKDTQFIIITHRRGTMAAADVLYGITMQEKGVSTLVSVNLIENELDK